MEVAMSSVRDLLRIKGAQVVSVSRDTTVRDAARVMNDAGTGSVLVLDGGTVVGIFTERDLLRRVVAVGLLPSITRVDDVMTTELVTCDPATSTEACALTMSTRRIRHLPVMDGTTLAGLVTTGDVLAYQLAEQASTIRQLEGFIYDGR